jgi:site-specific recombinase XerD
MPSRLIGPKWQRIIEQVIVRGSSPESHRIYRHALESFLAWYRASARGPFDQLVVQQYRTHLQRRKLAPGSINQQLTVLRRLAREAADVNLVPPMDAHRIIQVPNVPNRGVRLGKWLRREQAKRLVARPDLKTLKGMRDFAILGCILECGLRRNDVRDLTVGHLQELEGRCVIVNLRGKGNRLRHLPVPPNVKLALDAWLEATQITDGRVFRAVRKNNTAWGTGISTQTIWLIVDRYAREANLAHLAPHDLRRTFGRICYDVAKDLKQVQALLGHASVQTTERYLGVELNIIDPANDKIRIL